MFKKIGKKDFNDTFPLYYFQPFSNTSNAAVSKYLVSL